MVKKVNRLFTILSCFILFFTFLVMKNDEINPNEQFSIRNENLNSISKVVNHIITPDLPFNISEVGQWDFNYQGVPYDVEVVLNKAFVACLTGGVYVFDISDPSSPIYLNNYVNNTRAYSIDIQDDLALIADTELGMVILNISNPFDIYEISHAELELCYDVRVQDNLAFAVDHRSGLYIYDISEPNQPVFLGSYVNSSMGCYNVFINDSYAYLTTNYGLHIINITNPSTPTSIVIYQKESIMEHVLVEGELGYLCTNTYDDLTILNLTDVYNPEILCQYALDGTASSIEKIDDIIYASANTQIYIFNVSDSSNLLNVNNYTLNNNYYALCHSGNFLYAANYYNFTSLDISDIINPYVIGDFYFGGSTQDVKVKDDIAYIANSYDGVVILNISDKSSPFVINKFHLVDVDIANSEAPKQLEIIGDLLYVRDFAGLWVVNVSDPYNPEQLGYCGGGNVGGTFDMEIRDNVAFIVGMNGFGIYNTSNPKTDITNPDDIDAFSEMYSNTFMGGINIVDDIAILGSLVYGLYIVNISDLYNPVEIAHYFEGQIIIEATLHNDYLFVSNYNNHSIDIYQASNLSDISLISSENGTWLWGRMEMKSHYLFLATAEGLVIIDWSDINNPITVGQYFDGGESIRCFINNEYVYLSDGYDGMEILLIDGNSNGIPIYIDSDQDGLTDDEELDIYLTNPNDEDTDQDNLIDGDEVYIYQTNPNLIDTDADGIDDDDEILIYGTNPTLEDTDSDNLNDLEEISLGLDGYITNALNPDTDSDNLTDGEEYLLGTNPINSDSDTDGISDYEETIEGVDGYITNPLSTDTDSDGLTDYYEINTSLTDPTDDDSDDDGIDDQEEIIEGADGYITDPNDSDTDADGILDGEEVTLGIDGFLTNPTLTDTDLDGIDDWEEVNPGLDTYITDPNDSDSDDDGLLDGEEYTFSTDPNDSDSDDDGLDDNEEVTLGVDGYQTDPNDSDSDDDGLDDSDEFTNGTNPLADDSDGDGLDDQEELIAGSDGYVTDPLDADSDNDNLTDGEEYLHGTDPTDNDSDNDTILDGEEVISGDDGYITDPNNSDSDGDGIEDYEEIITGDDGWITNPINADTDSDGLIDSEEIIDGLDGYITDPTNSDTDADNLTDGEEFTYGTNPTNDDSDSDGLSDYEEVILGDDGYITNPIDSDSDHDGLNDKDEQINGTDPNDTDSDDDSINDLEEVTVGVDGYLTDPLNPDTDGDTFTDYEEILAGTDPTNPDDFPLTSTTPINGILIITIISFVLALRIRGRKQVFL